MRRIIFRLSLFITYSLLLINLVSADTCLKPFPQAVTYPYGIKPTNYTQAQMNQHVQDWWIKWRDKYLTQTNCGPGEWRVQRTETGNSIHKGCSENDTVSEGIAYGMIVCVYMSSATNNTKQYFDGLWRYYKNNSTGGLMDWQKPYCDSAGAATDADQDAAKALMVADKQWGSGGAINYAQEASDLIGLVLGQEITNGTENTLGSTINDVKPGNQWHGGNISYFAPYIYRMFGDYVGNSRWYSVATKTYQTIVNYYHNGGGKSSTYNSALGIHTGLMPNWCTYDGQPWEPTGGWAMRADTWWWDAIRHAWRQGYDYVLYGTLNHQLAHDNSVRVSTFFKTKYNGDPALIKSHYELDGTETTYCRGDRTPDLCTEDVKNLPGPLGAVAIAAMAGEDQTWLNALYDRLVNMDAGNGPGELTETGVMWGTDYFCDLLKMQYLLILTGNMPNPLGNYPSPTPTNTWDTRTPTPTPVGPGAFDDFETGVLKNPDTSESNGPVLTISNTNELDNGGDRSLKGVITGGTWAIFSIDSPYDGGLGYRNYTGATAVEFDIYCPAGKSFFVEIEEGTANGADGERFSNRGNPVTKTASTWQHIVIPLSIMTRDEYSPIKINNVFNLGSIVSFLLQFDNPGTMTFYIDNIKFTGNFPTPTRTPTASFTRTPAGTPTVTPSATRTGTNTPYYSPTMTRTSTVTPTNTPYFSPTITQTPTNTPAIPFGVFDNFETGVLESPDQNADGCVPTYSNSTANPRNGSRSLLIPFSPCAPGTGAWGSYVAVGSPYNTATDPAFWISFAGATQITFWINTPANTTFFLKIEEWESGLGGANADGEDFASANITKTTTGWQQYTINLSTFNQYGFSGRQGGNGVLNLSNIERVGFQFNGGTTGPVYIDDIEFLGMPVPTFTRTATRTYTPTQTPVLTSTFTATRTATGTFTSTVTVTSTTAQSPTFTATLTGTTPPSPTFTASSTATAVNTASATATAVNTASATATAVNTASATATAVNTASATGTAVNTATITTTWTPDLGPSHTATATFTSTPVVTVTFTSTLTMSATQTATLTATPSFTNTMLPTASDTPTPTDTITPTHSVSPTITQTPTGTPPTLTVTPTTTQTYTVTATVENTNTPLPSLTFTATITNTSTPSPTSHIPSSTATATVTATEFTAHSPTHTATPVNTFTRTLTATPTAHITGNTPTPTPTPTVLITFDLRVTKGDAAPSVIIPGTSVFMVDYTVTRNCDRVKFKLFTKSYRKVAEVLIASPQGAGGFRKEIPVSIFSGLSPGAYVYVIEAEGEGRRALSKAGVLTVIR